MTEQELFMVETVVYTMIERMKREKEAYIKGVEEGAAMMCSEILKTIKKEK